MKPFQIKSLTATAFIAPTFMVGNDIGNAHPAGDESPRYKIALKFLVSKLELGNEVKCYDRY